MKKSNLEKLDEIERYIMILKNQLVDTQKALQETMPYAIVHWKHNDEKVNRWKKLAGVI